MASGKVARRAAVGDVAELLDSPEVAALIEALAPRGRGRKGFGPRTLVGACLVKTLFSLPTWTRVAALIAEHPGLQTALGGTPSVWACYRFTVKLRENQPALADCLDAVTAALQAELPGIGVDVAIDASDMPAYANGQRYIYNGGPERQAWSDPDASWGHRSAVSTRKGGGFYGYKLHLAVCTATGLPLAWTVATARQHESRSLPVLLDAVQRRGFQVDTCAADRGYDSTLNHAECAARNVLPVIPRRVDARHKNALPLFADGTRNAPWIARHSERFKTLYKRRSAIEREFGRLKHDYGLAPLRVRGMGRVQLHADLVMLGRLAQALSRARAVQLAA